MEINILFKNKCVYSGKMKVATGEKCRTKSVNLINNYPELYTDIFNLLKCNSCDKYAHIKDICLDEMVYNNDNTKLYYYVKDVVYDIRFEHLFLYCKTCLKHLNPNSVEFIKRTLNVNNETALYILHKRNKSPFYIENHASADDYKQYQKRSKEWYLSFYGDEGLAKFNEVSNIMKETGARYKGKVKDSMSLDFHIKKYGDDGYNKYNFRLQSVNNNLPSLIKKYGTENGTAKHDIKINKLKYNMSAEYYTDLYGEDDGLRKWNEQKQKYRVTKNTFIRKYGEIHGTNKHKEWLSKITSNNHNTYSKECCNFFDVISSRFKHLTFLYGANERYIYDNTGYKNQNIFFYDCYIKELNLLIEYDTPAYHPNIAYVDKTIAEKSRIYNTYDVDKDTYKCNLAIKNNYLFYRVYVYKNKDEEITKLINYIKTHDSRKFS